MALSFGQQVGATDPYLSPDDLKRRRSLAELLMAQGNSGRPITHWMQGVDNALGSFLGAMLDKKDREDARAATTSATASANAGLAGLFGGSASSSPASSDAAVTAPTTPPDQVKSVIDANVPEEMRPFAYQLASKESSFDPSAVSPTGATGLFQFTRGTGAQYGLVGEGGDKRADPVANTQAFVRLTNDNRDRLRAGLGREPTFGELALAHQQGAGGALRLLSGQSVDPTNLRVNGVAPGTDPRAAASKIMRYYSFGPRADSGNGVQVAALGDTANDASPSAPPPASLPTFAALGQGTGGVMGGLGGAGAAPAPAAPDNPPLPPQRPPELASPAAAPATTASAPPRSIFVPSSMQPNMPEQAADRAAVLDVARSAQPFNVFAPRQPAALASPAGPAGSTAPPPVNAGSQVTSAPAASGPTQSAAPSAPASQAAPAAGQDGARIQTLSAILSNRYTPPGQRAVAQAALTELLKRNLDPTGQAIQREQLAAAQNNNALAPIERRIKEANATKAERDLEDAPPRPLTAEEKKQFGISDEQPAYRTRNEIKFGPAGSRVTVNNAVNPILKGLGDQFVESAATARSSVDTIRALHSARSQLDEAGGVFSGFGADAKLALQKIGSAMGVADPRSITNTETFRTQVKPIVLETVKGLGAGSGISNADREFALQAIGGDINLDESTIRRVLDITERAARYKIERHNTLADKMLESQKDLSGVSPMLRVDAPGDYVRPSPSQPPPPASSGAPASSRPSVPVQPPKVGDVQQGYRFKGGNPADRNSWERVQ